MLLGLDRCSAAGAGTAECCWGWAPADLPAGLPVRSKTSSVHTDSCAMHQVAPTDLERIEGRIGGINSLAQIKCAGRGGAPRVPPRQRRRLSCMGAGWAGAGGGRLPAAHLQRPRVLFCYHRRATKASVPLDYVLGVGGFDLEKVEADVSASSAVRGWRAAAPGLQAQRRRLAAAEMDVLAAGCCVEGAAVLLWSAALH